MCGVFGVVGNDNVFDEIVYGLTTLQHRGQDSSGIVTLDKSFHVRKGQGLASHVFSGESAATLPGKAGLGHIRYSTQGRNELRDAQPFTVNHPFGIAMVHNGNVTNFEALQSSLADEHHHMIHSSNDVELILDLLALELQKKNLKNLSAEEIFSSVFAIQKKVEGAYAVLAMIANQGMLAFLDPFGIRPLVLGRTETEDGVSYAFSSESTSFDHLGYEVVHNLQPGEIIFIDRHKRLHSATYLSQKLSFCVFEYIYFAKEDSVMHAKLIAGERERMGRALAKKFQEREIQPDIVIDVPSSAFFCAQGLAQALSIPYRRGLVKNNHAKRSFISSTQKLRETIVKRKLNPIKSWIRGKHVAVVDDSIVRGTTSKYIVQQLRAAGATRISFASAAPPIRHPCVYGIDMSRKSEMIAAKRSLEEVRQYIGVDDLIYPSVEDFRALYSGDGICDACFSGDYPTKIGQETLHAIEAEKLRTGR